ncbi:NAD(P)/FAD-dependent oxidoreductase [Flagellimonas baculiformis]|uniref:NAD(P)/FAD-dependent oxidoreductase n=1 Tax=Flagellimonas baculiformis TaxID=3067310 RepID=UPI00296F9CCA|nr:FAD/NAD(P)-binding oxidoreductase [Muricauda sp. D6]
MEHIVIIGNGIAGVTAARHIRKLSNKKITIVSAETDYFFSRTALMYVYMGHMKFEHTQPYENAFWRKNKINLVRARAETIDTQNKKIHVKGRPTKFYNKNIHVPTVDGEWISYDKLVIATGSKPNKFGWPGQDLEGVQGLYSKQDLDLLEQNAPNNDRCKRAVIVGGGLIGIELAEMLRTRDIPVTFLVRESSFWNGVLPKGDSQMINEHIREHHIDLRLNASLKEIVSDGNGKVKSVILEETEEEIPCNVVGLTAGVTPNIDFLKGSGIELGRGVKVNRFLETNIANVYAIGDCAEQHEAIGNRKPVEAVWYTGRMMGEVLAQTLCGNRMEYRPGHWFNSAKFLDIEYQTYGWVFPERKKTDSEIHFHWRHPQEKICITIAFDRGSETFLGINTFGIRMRHQVIDHWLNEKRDIDFVMAHLVDANFDPEFYKGFESEIVSKYNADFGKSITLKKKSLIRIFQ